MSAFIWFVAKLNSSEVILESTVLTIPDPLRLEGVSTRLPSSVVPFSNISKFFPSAFKASHSFSPGIHFIDTFQFIAGDVESVYAINRQLNPIIKGEDCALLIFRFANGAVGVWDSNRFNEADVENSRDTFGDFLVEGNKGSIRMDGHGKITIQKLGEEIVEYDYEFEVDPGEVFDLFMKPDTFKVSEKLRWGEVRKSKISELLVKEHDFSEDRVEKTTGQLVKSFEEKGKQKNLDQWF